MMPPGEIGAIVLAAGESKRMGQPKQALPWGQTTVIGRIAAVLQGAGAQPIIVVTGGARERVETALRGSAARLVHNPSYATSEMITSLQVGIRVFAEDEVALEVQAALIALGDQPSIEPMIIRKVMDAFGDHRSELIVPSYNFRRGHPWLIARSLWADLLAMPASSTPRDFLNRHSHAIQYVEVDSPSILMDLDTPEDYQRDKPAN